MAGMWRVCACVGERRGGGEGGEGERKIWYYYDAYEIDNCYKENSRADMNKLVDDDREEVTDHCIKHLILCVQ